MFYLLGDLHGHQNIYNFYRKIELLSKKPTEKDFVIFLGDFGIPWYNKEDHLYKKEIAILNELSSKPWTTLFIDGNHENFNNLKNLKEKDLFGDKVGILADRIFHLKRGRIYNIDSVKFFTFGGAASIDKKIRTIGTSWWPEEETNIAECDLAIYNLSKYDFEVDYVLTHTISYNITAKILNREKDSLFKDSVSKFLEYIEKQICFKHWFFGHFHVDKNIDKKFTCIQDNIICIDK